ncbi:MAG: MATE family efflux transporter [Acidobacteriota bacterium]
MRGCAASRYRHSFPSHCRLCRPDSVSTDLAISEPRPQTQPTESSTITTDPKLGRELTRLAIYNIAANLTVPLAGLVDVAMLGHLDEIRFLAGVALGGLIFDYVYWLCGFLRMSTTGLTAQAAGGRDPERGFRVLGRATLLAVTIGVVLLVLQRPLAMAGFGLLGGSPEVEAAGRDYFDARIWGAPATLVGLVLLGWFLGRAEPRIALWMTAVGGLSNIALNWLFIIELGWAARGAGLATMLSQYLLVAVGLVAYWQRRKPTAWRLSELLDRQALGALLALNRDILIRTLCLVTSFAVFLNVSAVLGTVMLAANSILFRLFTTSAYLIDGIAHAAEILAGTARGRGEPGELARVLRLTLIAGAVFAGVIVGLLALFPAQILGLLTNHGDVIDVARAHLPFLFATIVVGAFAFVYDGFFIGLTEGRAIRNSMLLATLGLFAPLAALAWWQKSTVLIWVAMIAFMAGRALFLWWPSRRLVAT